MGRPNLSAARRAELLPVVAAAFAELGYRRTTTAELASRCGMQETSLYRLWPDKRAMFIAAIDYVFEHSKAVWVRELDAAAAAPGADGTPAEAVLGYEATHLGEFGLYRILFAGLSETDDAEIQKALKATYRGFHRFLQQVVVGHREARAARAREAPDPDQAAWALLGVGTMISLLRELDLVSAKARRELLAVVGRQLLG